MQGIDLFASQQRLPMPDAEVEYFPEFLSSDLSREVFWLLRGEIDWRESQIKIWGKEVKQPRLIAWYGDTGRSYKYSGVRFEPLPWTESLLELRRRVESATSNAFNSVLLNLYRGASDSMGWHSDDEPELGPRPVIASLSLGDTRIFQFRHKVRKDIGVVKLPLAPGSLLTMAGATQLFWQHSIQKESRRCGERINLTFRKIVTGSSRSDR